MSSERVEAAIRELADAIREELRSEMTPTVGAPARLYSVEEAAELLGVGRSLAYDLIHAGELRSIKAGRRRLVSSSAIVEYANRSAREADA